VAQVHAINTLLSSVKSINAMKVLFNISGIISLTNRKSCKGKDFCSRPRT